jgi:hypothetical protein
MGSALGRNGAKCVVLVRRAGLKCVGRVPGRDTLGLPVTPCKSDTGIISLSICRWLAPHAKAARPAYPHVHFQGMYGTATSSGG